MEADGLTRRFVDANGVLLNKLGIHDEVQLARREYEEAAIIGARILHRPLPINGFSDLQAIHRALFGWLYDWAGVVRDYDLTKGTTTFLPVEFISRGIATVNQQITAINQTSVPTIKQYAQLLDSANFLHPFREGNGRATKLLIQKLAKNKRQIIDYDPNDDALVDALVSSDIPRISALMWFE